MGRRLAAHLLRRTTFGATRAEIDAYAAKTADKAVDDLLAFPTIPAPPIDPATNQTWVVNGPGTNNSASGRLYSYVVAWWADEARTTTNMLHKMMFFLHQNFTSDRSINSVNLYNQLRLFRYYAKGSYKTLARKMCMDNGMLGYLNATQSSKNNPNENFPRELLELFTIGKGPQIAAGNYTTYTEGDIQAASRLMTGFRRDNTWNTIDSDTGIPMGKVTLSQHDTGNKTFSAAFNSQTITGRNTATGMAQEVDDLINMIFGKLATAQNIARKLYRYFVHPEISAEVERDIIAGLARDLYTNNYNLERVLKLLLKSQHFYDADDSKATDETIGGIIKTPLELYIGTLKYFNVSLPNPATDADRFYRLFYHNNFIYYLCKEAGLEPFHPPNVAGYPGLYQSPSYDKQWINANSLSFRYLFADMLLQNKRILTGGSLYAQIGVMAFVTNTNYVKPYAGKDPLGNNGPHAGPRIATHLVSELLDYLLPEAVPTARFNYFLNDLLLGNLSTINWMFEWDDYVTTGDDSTVKPQIQKLIRGILQSPEYQLA